MLNFVFVVFELCCFGISNGKAEFTYFKNNVKVIESVRFKMKYTELIWVNNALFIPLRKNYIFLYEIFFNLSNALSLPYFFSEGPNV